MFFLKCMRQNVYVLLLKLHRTVSLFKMSQHIVSLAKNNLLILIKSVNMHYHAGKEMGIRLLPCQKQPKLLEMDSTLRMVPFQKTFPTR